MPAVLKKIQAVFWLMLFGAPPCWALSAEAREFIRWQLCDGFGDFFDFHMAEHSTFLVRAGLRQMVAMVAGVSAGTPAAMGVE